MINIKDLPPLLLLRRLRYERAFRHATDVNWFRGVYATYQEAERAAPKTKSVGYDTPALAQMYRERLNHAYPGDYPVLFWMKDALKNTSRVFDFGGHVGIHYYAYAPYLPKVADWLVCDVPAVTTAGEALAKERHAEGLRFTNTHLDSEGADVWLAAGSLQYVDWSLMDMLKARDKKPKWVLVNKLPVHASKDFYTVQNTGHAFHAYRIFSEPTFLAAMGALGYERRDTWNTLEHWCKIPFHPEHSIAAYTGYAFELRQ